ncbi:MAG: endonuclease III [Candidatus Thermoplasmatota archaeon]|nr:endonuclease III [Candidatus Thermoplasmatota archaeon]
MTQINHIDDIMSILASYYNNHPKPLVSRNKWTVIPKTPYTVLISCLLSLRTKDEVTEEASIRLLKDYNNPEQMVTLSEKTIQKLIYPVGFYKVKAKRIKELSKTLIESYDRKVPNDFNTLLSLHGIGRKTANIVMLYGFNNSNYLPIDTHCHRIPNRLGWISTRTPEETEEQLKTILPLRYWKIFNHLFVMFGQTICTPLAPYCSKCPIHAYCLKENLIKHR